MLQLRMNLTTDSDTPKTAMLAPCEFKEQLEIKMTWVKRFMVNLKALYQLGKSTTCRGEKRSVFAYGWDFTKAVLSIVDQFEGDVRKAAAHSEAVKLAFNKDLLLERI